MADGVILYSGPSLIDGQPIVAIATGLKRRSENEKTGGMVQTYILRSGVAPTIAVKTGADASICGDCPHRGNGDGGGRTCYVNVGQGPQAVWRAYRAGGYDRGQRPGAVRNVEHVALPGLFAGRVVRLGTYGDPAAVPAWVWSAVTAEARAWTGYTHQWRRAGDLRQWCMASVDSAAEAAEAQAAGWRTFRVRVPGDLLPLPTLRESTCPASAEAGKKLTCAQCLACGGGNRRGSITIAAHGGFAVMANVKRRAA